MNHIVITGVSTGIGAGCTEHLIKKGYHVFGSVRNKKDAAGCKKRYGEAFTPLIFDVRDIESIRSAAQLVKDHIGMNNLAGLVNNAGIAESGPIQHIDPSAVQRQFDINVVGLINITQAFLPLLGGRKDNVSKPGRIINISSVAGTFTLPLQIPYAASKHAVESITDGMRREFEIYGIKVISIRPGPIRTEIWAKERAKEETYLGTAYENLWLAKSDIIDEREQKALPISRISHIVEQALVKPNPKLRYLVVRNRFRYYLMRLLPSRWVDRMLKRQMGKMGHKL